ncbi:MAG: CshA/CshB family fibrillar adhesin-related protein, partial [Aestuariivirga sp.]
MSAVLKDRGRHFVKLVLLALAWTAIALANAASAATCGPATSAGTAPPSWQTYCWIDMSTYNNATVFGGGQVFSITLSDGSVLSFTMSGTSSGGAMTPVVAPAWSGAAVGNTAFLGIPNKPILYTTVGGTVNLTLSNIKVTPPNGVVSTGQYKLVVADGESTNSSESLTFTTNGGAWAVDDQVPPISGAIYPTITGAGTATFTETGVGGTVGAYIVGSLSPSTVTVQLVAGGLQGIMLAVQYSSVSINKVISGSRANSADQFTYGGTATSNGSTLASATSTGAGGGPFGAAVVTMSSGVAITINEAMAAGSVSNISQYTPKLNCTNGNAGSPTTLPSNQPVTSFNLSSTIYGDAIACTFTNTAKTATVSLQKIT